MSEDIMGLEEVEEYKESWFGNFRIRNKLLVGFLAIIALILVLVVISLITQSYTTKTVDEVLNVHNKMALFSLYILPQKEG